jgi:hypothetical protein
MVAKVEGKVIAEKKLISAFALAECVFYRCIREEFRKQGKSSKWVKARDETNSIPFMLEDKTGQIKVDLQDIEWEWINADLICNESFHEDLGLFPDLFERDNVRKKEWAILKDTKLFVYGMARNWDGKPCIVKDQAEKLAAGVNGEKEFIEKMRSNDKSQTVVAYGMAFVGTIGIAIATFIL